MPLYATLAFSLREKPQFAAYANTFNDPKFAGSLIYSFVIGVVTIIVSIVIIVPTAYWVRLRLPRLRPLVEFFTLLPFVIPPVILVFGLIRSYSGDPFALTGSDVGSNLLLVSAYVVLSFPYMYRAVDTGLRAVNAINDETDLPDVRWLEASNVDAALDAIQTAMLQRLALDYAAEVDVTIGPRSERLSQKAEAIRQALGSGGQAGGGAGRIQQRRLRHTMADDYRV